MERLFNYRPEGVAISTDAGEKDLMAIRKGPRGIVGVIKGEGPIVIWDKDNSDSHASDSEEDLKSKLIDVLNA